MKWFGVPFVLVGLLALTQAGIGQPGQNVSDDEAASVVGGATMIVGGGGCPNTVQKTLSCAWLWFCSNGGGGYWVTDNNGNQDVGGSEWCAPYSGSGCYTVYGSRYCTTSGGGVNLY